MCGIVGFIDHRLGAERAEATIDAMSHRLRHRGPDDHGKWTDPATGVALGHRRLSIVDLSPQGHQPMVSACGRYVIVYNGEIYNFREVRGRLEADYGVDSWRGHSDTEVLLAALTHRGLRGALEWLVGMFAFAVWDRAEHTLSLARDRMGEKPLYFGSAGAVFFFASELKAFAAHPAWRGQVDPDAVGLLMRYGYVPVPYSIYRDVFKLAPGGLVTVRVAGGDAVQLEHATYWSVLDAYRAGAAAPFEGSAQDAVTKLDALLTQSVGLQMVADVPLGAFLSGGIDSSTIVALMQAQSSRKVRTFSIGFEEASFNEARHAAAVAKHLGTQHTEVYVTSRETLDVIPRLPTLFDEPFADSSQIPSFLVAQLARRDVTVALSGDGGDELFYGYRRFVDTRRFSRLAGRLPRAGRSVAATGLRAAARAVGSVGRRRMRLLRKASDTMHKAALLLSSASERELYWDVLSHWSRGEAIVPRARAAAPALIGTAPVPSDMDDWMMYQDMVAFLPDDVLVKVDRTSMGVGLEARAPLLDHRIVEFSWRIPFAWKYRDGQGKWLLRQVLYRHVPRELVDRPKMGFDVPVANWLRGELRDWAEALLDERAMREQGYFDVACVLRKWSEHLTGRRNWQYCLWDVLMFQAWIAEHHPGAAAAL